MEISSISKKMKQGRFLCKFQPCLRVTNRDSIISLDPKDSPIKIYFCKGFVPWPFGSDDLKVTKGPRKVQNFGDISFILKNKSHEIWLKDVGSNFLLRVPGFENGAFESIRIYMFLQKDTSNNCEFIVEIKGVIVLSEFSEHSRLCVDLIRALTSDWLSMNGK